MLYHCITDEKLDLNTPAAIIDEFHVMLEEYAQQRANQHTERECVVTSDRITDF